MIRFNVIEKTETNALEIIQNPEGNALALADFYRSKLAEAAAAHAELICFENIPFSEKNSDNFQNIYILEKCIMDTLRNQKFPNKVQIVCEDAKTAELYKVVYNFYYPGSKADRLEDESWD